MSKVGPGRIYVVQRAFRQSLLRQERDASTRMVRTYAQSWVRLRGLIEDLIREGMAALERGGQTPGIEWIRKLERYKELEAQIRREFANFAEFANPLVAREQRIAVDAAIAHSEVLTRVALGEPPPGVAYRFNQVPREALIDLVGFSGDGSPLRRLFDALGPDAGKKALETLTSGFTLGQNPRKIASDMRAAMGMQLDRALTISRTETLRAYREATRRSFKENDDVVGGWVWISARDARVCASCWAMHGTKHTNDETLDDHPNGRCNQSPITKSWAELGFPGVDTAVPVVPSGADEFAKLDPEKQRQILGNAAYEAYRAGAVTLQDFVGRKYSPDWGSMRYARSLSSILGAEESLRYRGAANQTSEE